VVLQRGLVSHKDYISTLKPITQAQNVAQCYNKYSTMVWRLERPNTMTSITRPRASHLRQHSHHLTDVIHFTVHYQRSNLARECDIVLGLFDKVVFNSRIFVAIRMSADTCGWTCADWALWSSSRDVFEAMIALRFLRGCNWRHDKLWLGFEDRAKIEKRVTKVE
jgi:hypothetical protein